jgi:phosphonopyruvate decarboxylase
VIAPALFLEACRAQGITFFTGVPDSLLASLNSAIMTGLPRDRHVIAANEGAAVGIAIGHYLRTGEPAAVYLQNSGLGNLVNPLLSLADPAVYGIPMLLIVGWRGQPGVPDEPQHVTQGRLMPTLLDALEVPWAVLPREPAAVERCVKDGVAAAVARGRPCALLVEKGTFAAAAGAPGAPAAAAHEGLASREEALAALVDAVGPEALIVSTTGMLSRELFALRAARGESGERDFLTVGGMGHASAIALGVAMREPRHEVWCFDGDGALLMHLGSLATIADHAPERFFHVVFNNGVHDSVGGQPTSIGRVDVAATARAVGYRGAESTVAIGAIAEQVARLRADGGPSLLEVRVRPGSRPDLGRPTRTPEESRRAFMSSVCKPEDRVVGVQDIAGDAAPAVRPPDRGDG